MAIAKNINPRHHRMKPNPLPKKYRAQRYLLAPKEEAGRATKLDGRVAHIDFKLVKSILLMVNAVQNKLDKLGFRDENNTCLASLTCL